MVATYHGSRGAIDGVYVLAGGFPRVLLPPCAVSPLWCFPPAVSGWGSVWVGLTPRLLSFDGTSC